LIAEKEKADRNKKKGALLPVHELPANTPAWFRECDTDGDGQVALHEWKARGYPVEDFRKADLNGDNFITLHELMRAGLFVPDPHFGRPPQSGQPGQNGQPVPNPTSARRLADHVGRFFIFEMTGTTEGMVWGTDVYTVESPMAVAAVHAGVLRAGEKRFVKVTILPGQDHYEGSTQNGVTTHDFGPTPACFRVERP
jgi:hypothetical protein